MNSLNELKNNEKLLMLFEDILWEFRTKKDNRVIRSIMSRTPNIKNLDVATYNSEEQKIVKLALENLKKRAIKEKLIIK